MPGVHHPHSPSALERQEKCPGSFQMCNGFTLPDSDDAEEGTRLHAAVVPGAPREGLSLEDAERVGICDTFVSDLVDTYPDAKVYHEIAMPLVDGFEVLSEGTADLVVDVEALDLVIVADWKFGRKPVTAAEDNLQVKTYGTMGLQKYRRRTAQVHVVQPTIRSSSFATFGAELVPAHVERVRTIIARAHRPNLELRAGAHCTYCPRLGTCVTARQAAISTIPHGSVELIEDPDRLASLLRLAKLAIAWGEAVERQAKSVGLRNDGLPGFRLKTRQGNRTIREAEKAFELLSGYFTPAEFLACAKVSVGNLEAAFAAKRLLAGKVPKKALVEEFAALLAPVLARDGEVKFLEALD